MNLSEWNETGDRFSWRGQEVFYQEAGEGEVLFLLHGFIASGWIYKYLWPTLSEHYRVIAPDFIGFGFSSKPTNYNYGIEERVEMIYAVADLLSIDKCHILAQGFGVNVAQDLLKRQIEGTCRLEIPSVVLLNGAIFSDQSRMAFHQRLMLIPFLGRLVAKILRIRVFKATIKRRVGPYFKFPEDLLDDLYYQLEYRGGVHLVHKFNKYLVERERRKKDLEQALLNTNVPVQLIWGIAKEDQIAGVRSANQYRKLKGDQYVVMLKDVGLLPLVESPELVLEYFFNFQKGLTKL